MRRVIALLPFVLLAGCVGSAFPSYGHFAPELSVSPRPGTSGPEVDALATRFYDVSGMAPEEARREVDALLARYPHASTLHEMAAHLAELRQDDAAAWAHWLSASADTDSAFASIYLDRALAYDLTIRQQSTTAALLERFVAEHPDPPTRVEAARRLISIYQSRERYEDADQLARGLGYIRDFQLIGAFDNDQGRGFHAEHPPETEVDFDGEYRGLLLPVRWRPATQLDRTGLVRIGDQISPDRWAVAYLATHVSSDTARDAQLRLTVATGTRVWLNGALVVDQEHLAHGATDNIVVPVHLDAGWNRILVKSAQDDSGAWVVGARLTDMDGRAIPSLRYDRAMHDVRQVTAAELPPNESPIAAELAALEPPLRRAILEHHDANRNGFEGDALSQARALLELAPQHPVVVYHAALTHWKNDELGRAMDLLNDGATRFAEQAGFLWQRGAFYRERDRYDRAIEDLSRAVELSPEARLARMELASTFQDRRWHEHQCRVLDEVLTRWPDSAWALRARGHCAQSRGYLDEARAMYERSDALEPGRTWTLDTLASLARYRERHAEAVAYAERARALAPWSVTSMIEAADQLRFAGRRNEARALYGAVSSIDPTWARAHHRLGTMAYEEGDEAGALSGWAAALARDPDNGALADRVDFLRGHDADPDRLLMPGDEQIEAALARASEMEIDPGAHTVLILDDEVTTVNQDGSSMRRITQVHLAVTTDGRDELIGTHVPANARILQAFSVGADDSRQEASSIRGGTLRFRGLDAGSRVVLQYVYHAPPPAFLPNHFVSSWVFQGVHRQLGEARWVVMAPAGRELAMDIQGPVEHTVRSEGGFDHHIFTASNVPPLVPEPAMPPTRDLVAMVTLSTLTDWNEYVEWERALLSEVFESNPALARLAVSLTEGATTQRERLDRLYRYASQEIRYQQDYEDTIAGVRPHSCPVVLERGYGDCKDKAVLMMLLGRQVGIDIRFTVLRTTGAGRVQTGVPNQQFNHAIIYVPAQEGIDEAFFMDPTTDGLDMGNLRADDQGATALVLDPSNGEWEFVEIPYQAASLSYFNCDLDVSVTSSEVATAEARCQLRGSVGSMFRRVMRNEERASQLRQNVAHSFFQGSRVTGSSSAHVEDIDHPLELNLSLDASPALQPQGEERRIAIPSPFSLGRLTRLESRRTPLRLGPPDSARWEVTVEAPAGGRIVRAPDDFQVEHSCFSVSRATVTRGRRATVTVTYERTCPEVAPADYPELRRLAQRANNQLQADVVIAP